MDANPNDCLKSAKLWFEAVPIDENVLESTNFGLQQHSPERAKYFIYFGQLFVLLAFEHNVCRSVIGSVM